jgi:hypothetical protein
MRARSWYFWAASLLIIALVLLPSAMSISWFGASQPVYSSITVLAAAFASITLGTKIVWPRSSLIFWGLGISMLANVVPLAETGGSTWSVWTVGMMSLGAIILARNMEFLSEGSTGPGFEADQERRTKIDLVLLAMNGMAFFAMTIVIAVLLFLTVPFLTFSGVSVWLLGLLAIGFMVLLTWLARSEPS